MRSRSLFAWVIALGSCLPATAQILPAEQSRIFWRIHDLATVKDGFCTLESRSTRKATSFKIPSDFRDIHATDDGFWANRKTGRESNREIEIHFSPDGTHWHLQTAWPVSAKTPNCRIFALQDSFLAIATSAPFTQGEASSHFAVLRQKEGNRLEIQELLPMEIGKNSPDWIFVPTVVQIPDGWAIVYGRTGHVWLVKDTGGQSVRIRKLKLYPAVQDSAIQSLGSIDPPILGCQPTPDGDLLIASRSEEAVLKGREFAKQHKKAVPDPPLDDRLNRIDFSQGSSPEQEAKLRALTQGLSKQHRTAEEPVLQAFPEVLWWNLDPASGTFKRIAAPDGAPEKLLTLEVFHGFRFRFNVKGELRVSD